MAETKTPPSPQALRFQEAMSRLSAGDLTPAVKAMLEIHEQYLDSEEAFFVEEQLARVRRLWPDEAAKAGLTEEAWKALQERAAKRRAAAAPPKGAPAVIALLVVAAGWALMVTVAPRAAFLNRVPDVPLIFRLVSAVIGIVSAGTAFGLMKLKWEAVNAFIVLSPVFMIATFIGLTEAWDGRDHLAVALCALALAAEAAAAWYMSKQSHRFIY